MGNSKIGMQDLSKAVSELLEEELKAVEENADKICEKVAKETRKIIKDEIQNIAGGKGTYAKAIRLTSEKIPGGKKVYKISAGKKEYRLTHLLEDGHRTNLKTGKYGKKAKTRAFPHFSVGAEYADKRLDELVKELIDDN